MAASPERANRHAAVIPAGGPLAAPVWQYAYDSRNNLIKQTDPLSRVTQIGYDAGKHGKTKGTRVRASAY